MTAIDRLNEQKIGGRRIAVLGQMAELGPPAISYHTELAAVFAGNAIDRVYVTGELYSDFWKALPAGRKGEYSNSLAALKETLLDELADGDIVLFKGSNSTRIHELVAWIKESNGQTA